MNNSYPKKFIDRVKTRITNKAPLGRNWTSTVCVPCVLKISEVIRNALNPEGIRVAFTSLTPWGSRLPRLKTQFLKIKQANWFTSSHARTVQQYTSVRPLDQRPTEWRNIRGSPRGTRKTTRSVQNSKAAKAFHVLETEHHVDFENPEILSKYWPIYRDRINAEQWFISHQPKACNLKGKTTHPAWNLI